MIGKHEDAVAVLHQSIELRPEDPLNWCRLSLIHSTRERHPRPDSESLKAALAAIDQGVEAARRVGALVRYCLNSRCRIVVSMRRYDLLEETLREILTLPVGPGIPDIGLEDDFLRRVPEGAVDSGLLATYRAALAEQEARRASRPPAAPPSK